MTKREIIACVLGALLMALGWTAYQDHLKTNAMWIALTSKAATQAPMPVVPAPH
jgi:hypothetical protein